MALTAQWLGLVLVTDSWRAPVLKYICVMPLDTNYFN